MFSRLRIILWKNKLITYLFFYQFYNINYFIMPIVIHLDEIMSKRKMSLNELSEKVGITLSNLSIIKNQKSKAIRLNTLDAICKVLHCQPGDILRFVE